MNRPVTSTTLSKFNMNFTESGNGYSLYTREISVLQFEYILHLKNESDVSVDAKFLLRNDNDVVTFGNAVFAVIDGKKALRFLDNGRYLIQLKVFSNDTYQVTIDSKGSYERETMSYGFVYSLMSEYVPVSYIPDISLGESEIYYVRTADWRDSSNENIVVEVGIISSDNNSMLTFIKSPFVQSGYENIDESNGMTYYQKDTWYAAVGIANYRVMILITDMNLPL